MIDLTPSLGFAPAASHETVPPAVLAWALEVCSDELEGRGYDFATATKDKGLPDVVTELERSSVVATDPRFPWQGIQQMWLEVFEVMISIMVDNTDPQAAAHMLRRIADKLTTQALKDTTLGRRVFLTSPNIDVDYVPQLVEYSDGTIGRQVQVSIAVSHPIEEPA